MPSNNPSLRIEITEIDPDGLDIPVLFDFIGTDDLSFHAGNKPPKVTCNIQKTLGSSQDTASITVNNSLYIETFRKNYQAELAKFRGKKLRVRIWAWYNDNNTVENSAEETSWPVFVGDILDGFSITSDSITDSSIQFQAQGHAWLMTSGKMRETWSANTSYLEIFAGIFDYIRFEKGQGRETIDAVPTSRIDDTHKILEEKLTPTDFVVDRNPSQVLNDLCKEVDYVWGIHNNIPYALSRERAFDRPFLPIGRENNITSLSVDVNYETGLQSVISYGMYDFSFTHNYDKQFIPGRIITILDSPQINVDNNLIAGRINEATITLDNYTGHKIECHCGYLTEFSGFNPVESKVVLPERNQGNSGARYQ